MAKITPKTSSTFSIGDTNLIYDASSAQLLAADGQEIWSVAASMFPPAQAGVPPTLTVVEKTTKRTTHLPPTTNGGGDPESDPQPGKHKVEKTSKHPDAGGPTVIITITKITIELTGARFAGTQIPADFTMTAQQTTRSDDPGGAFPILGYTQSFGNFSSYGEVDDYSGYLTVTAPLPAGTISLPEGGTAALSEGLAASIDLAPGVMKFYTASGTESVATGSAPLLGSLAPTTLIVAATGTYDVFGFPTQEPAYEINLTFSQAGGWSVPLPASTTGLGTLSLAPGNNYDSAVIAVGEDTAGNISYLAAIALELAASAATQVQYGLALTSGLSLLGDTTGAAVALSLVGCELVFNFLISPPGASLQGSIATPSSATLTTGSIALWPAAGGWGGTCAIDFSPSVPGAALVQEAFLYPSQALCSLPDAVTRPLPFSQDGTVALVTGPPPATAAYASYVILGGVAAGVTQAFISGISLEVTRPADMMVASFSFQNCGVTQNGDGTLYFGQWVADQDNPAVRMTVTLPPQHISECAFPLNDDNTPIGTLGPVPVAARMAGATSLMLQLPATATTPLSAAALLDWTSYTLVSPQPGLTSPPDPYSASVIELPYKLLLALDSSAGWVQPPPPDPSASASPLWHARLGVQQQRADGTGSFVNERPGVAKIARAPWSWDMSSTQTAPVFTTEALTPQNREDIVSETEQAALPGTAIAVDHLILSSLGAWTDLRTSWPGGPLPTGDSLTAWTQIISQGRDQYIRAVNKGYLLPWGHAASIVQVAERHFSNDAANTAYLCQKSYIVVAQVSRTYTQQPDGTPLPRDGALTQIDLLTQITPAFDNTTGAIAGTNGLAFWPYVNGQPFYFHARVYDADPFAPAPGKPADTQLGAIFIDGSAPDASITLALNAFNTGSVGAAANQVKAAANQAKPQVVAGANALVPAQISPFNTPTFGGQKLALATSKVAGDTTHAITNLTMQVNSLVPDGTSWNLASQVSSFYPAISQAYISLPAVGLLTANSATNVAVSYLPQYLDPSSIDGSNPVDAYMQLATPVTTALSGLKANGLVAPALTISGLSRTFGALTGDFNNPTAPLAGLLSGTLDPANFFPSSAMLLNLIPFSDLVGTISGLTAFDSTHIPQVKVDTSDPKQVVATMNWSPSATAQTNLAKGQTLSPPTWTAPRGFVTLTLDGDLTSSISLNSTIVAATSPVPLPGPVAAPVLSGPPVSTMVATVKNFHLNVLGLVTINFDHVTVTSVTGKKPTVQVGLTDNPFVLTGQIDFLQILFSDIKALFDNGPSVSVDAEAITLSFEFAVPEISMGIFDLSNIAIGVDVVLSLGTNPIEFHFHYAGPDNPFDLAIDLLGGGGYFVVDASDLQQTAITMAAQAGASVSLDLGVASGSVSIMLGAFFQSSTPGVNGPEVGGYVRADGQLTVLELITLHVSFYLGVTYAPEEGILWGEASVTVEVSVLFFHKSVSLTMRKQFPVKLPKLPLAERGRPALHAADTTPAPWPIPRDQIMSAADWTTYTQAFV